MWNVLLQHWGASLLQNTVSPGAVPEDLLIY